MNLQLRPATIEDMNLLYEWANDAQVRQNSFNTAPIPYENHVKWFNNIMADDSVLQYILCDNVTPLGQIRLNITDSTALISYSISPENRGKGLGTQILMLVTEKVRNERPEINVLVGQVKYENPASAKAFEKCGFIMYNKPEYIEYQKSV